MRIEYYDIPKEVKIVLEPLLESWLLLLPTWCHEVDVFIKETDDSWMSNETKPEYRKIRLLVSASWLREPPWKRSLDVRHELLHASLAPLVHLGWDIIERYVKDETADSMLREQWRLAFEGVVADLEHATDALNRS